MTNSPTPGSIAVVGGGIAGLVAAVQAATTGTGPVTLIDTGPGRARTTERDGVHLNEGPHALYLDGALGAALREWGIDLPGGSPDITNYWAVDGDRVTRFPVSPRALASTGLLNMRGKLAFTKLQLQLARMKPADLTGTSVATWLADQPDDVRRVLLTLVRLTTYVNAPELLDAGAVVAQLQLAVGGGVRYLDNGWGSVTEALHTRFADLGGRVVTGQQATSVVGADDGATVHTTEAQHAAEAVVLATGGPGTAVRLLGIDLPSSWRLTPVEATCLDLWTSKPPAGSLYVDPDRDLYLSVHSPVAALTPPGVTLVSLLHYLPAEQAPGRPEEEKAMLRAHAAHAGIDEVDVLGSRYLHRMTVAHGFPEADRRGIGPTVDSTGVRRVFVAGDWVDSGAFLADASAASGRDAASAAIAAARGLVGAGRG